MTKKIIWLFFLLIFCVLGIRSVSAEEIPVLKDVQVKVEVRYEANLRVFTYAYTIINPSTNTGGITNVQLDISKPENVIDLSADGLTISHGVNPRGVMLIRSFEEEILHLGSLLEIPVIPVGTKTPDNWNSGISVGGTISWGSKGDGDIMPGKSLSGFEVLSRGLPAIRCVKFKPFWVLSVEGFVTEEDIEKSKRIKEQITFRGKTIGPTAPPADFKPVEFINYIIGLKHQSTSLGWIKNKGIEQSLDAKLDNAKKKIEEGNVPAAKNILNAFINEIEAQGCKIYEDCPKGKHLTPEAYALMKYNVQYLISNLK